MTPTAPTGSPFTNLVKPDVTAPGGSDDGNNNHEFTLALPGGSYGVGYGTSFAAPHAAGVAAMVQSFYKGIAGGVPAEEMEFYLAHGTINNPGHQPYNVYGFGMIDAASTLNILSAPGHCNTGYTDIESYWDYAGFYISTLSCGGVVTGFTGSQCSGASPCFEPWAYSTRGQFVKMADIAYGIVQYTPPGGGHTFTDVLPGAWDFEYVESAVANHLISGMDANSCIANGQTNPCFLPNLAVTRGQAMVMIQRARVYPVYTPPSPTFTDVSVGSFDYTAVETLVHEEIIIPNVDPNLCAPGCSFNANSSILRTDTALYMGRSTLHISNNP